MSDLAVRNARLMDGSLVDLHVDGLRRFVPGGEAR
jgi:hypothetical protein